MYTENSLMIALFSKKISRMKAEKDLYKIIFELLKEHNADPTIIKEKIIFE